MKTILYNLSIELTDRYGSGFILSILDSSGFFEYDYQQFDVLEDTGYWVYFNKWTWDWEKRKYPWLNNFLRINQ